jgi:hypothetical protein
MIMKEEREIFGESEKKDRCLPNVLPVHFTERERRRKKVVFTS